MSVARRWFMRYSLLVVLFAGVLCSLFLRKSIPFPYTCGPMCPSSSSFLAAAAASPAAAEFYVVTLYSLNTTTKSFLLRFRASSPRSAERKATHYPVGRHFATLKFSSQTRPFPPLLARADETAFARKAIALAQIDFWMDPTCAFRSSYTFFSLCFSASERRHKMSVDTFPVHWRITRVVSSYTQIISSSHQT